MEERTLKLLILAGDEGVQHEARDFGKIVQIIVEQYLSKNQEQNADKIISKLSTVIERIPLKQHMYAGLTAKISLKNKDNSNQIIQNALNQLQKSLSEFMLYESINILNYLSELMNISLLNSLAFMNILEDILDVIQSESNPHSKRFFISVLIRSLPVCINSLSQKLFQDLKKFMDLLQKHAQNDPLFVYLRKLVNKGKTVNFSLMSRLGQDFSGVEQFNIKRKLKIDFSAQKSAEWTPVEYINLNKVNEDELYKQFAQEEGKIHQLTIQQLIETFYPRSTILYTKMQNYLSSIPSHKEAYLYQLTISSLIGKCLKSSHPIVEQSLLLNIVNNFNEKSNEEMSNLTKVELSKMLENQTFQLFSKGENLDFSTLINVANLISFVINGSKSQWDWDRYIQNQESFVRRRVLLILILEKTKVLNDNFVLPESLAQFSHYEAPEKLTNQIQYTTAEQMQIFQGFENALKSKSNADTVKQMIKNEQEYQIFLETLFRRTSLSQTHFKTLIQRYKQVLQANSQFDWALINKIRNFWKKSYLNRLMYLQMMIKAEFITFNSYVNYIGQLKDKNQRQMIWIKIQLNQLNNLFGNSNKKAK